MAKNKKPKEQQPNFEEEVVGGHPSAHAEAHGMTEDDLTGGKLTPEAKARLEQDFKPNAKHVPDEG